MEQLNKVNQGNKLLTKAYMKTVQWFQVLVAKATQQNQELTTEAKTQMIIIGALCLTKTIH